VIFGATDRVTERYACAHFGVPQRITSDAGGVVTWHYGSIALAFKGNRGTARFDGP
jgi:hypothetical protein